MPSSSSSLSGGKVGTPATTGEARFFPNDSSVRKSSTPNNMTAPTAVSFAETEVLSLHYFPWWTKWIAAAVCFVAGTFCAYAFKWQNKVVVARCGDMENPDCEPKQFVGAFWQTFLMFCGETLCLVVWYIDDWRNKKLKKVNYFDFTVDTKSFVKPMARWYHWIIPSMLDNFATLFCNIGYTLTYASTVQMLRNFLVVISAFTQLIILRRALRYHEWIGVVLITGAMVLTAIPAVLEPEESDHTINQSKAWLGILMALLGTACQGVMFVVEEAVYRTRRYSPVKAVGVEGVVGLITVAIMMPIAQYANFEDVGASLYQFGHSTKIGIITLFYLMSCMMFNSAGQACVKLGSALLKAIMFALRAPAVWLLDLANKWITFDYYNLGGMFVFLIGFFIYVRCYPPEKFPALHKFLSTPWHWCCTKPELDEDYVPPEDDEKFAIPEQGTRLDHTV